MATQQQSPADPTPSRRMLAEAVIASTVGTTIEWYDFFLYGTAAALVFPQLFFPTQTPFAGQIASFLTFAAGFLARPLGGLFFGYLGDRLGRKATLVATLLLMGISTALIGLLPTFDDIGGAAPILLTLLRVLQGVGVGGEWGGAVLLALESGHRGRRGFYASWPQAGVPLGLLASTGVFRLVQGAVPPDDFLAWGWRIPFLLSAVLIGVGLLIRVRIAETPLFQQVRQEDRLARAPVTETLRRHWGQVLLAAGTRLNENACFYLFSVYVLDYGRKVLQVSDEVTQGAVLAAAAVEFFTIPLFGMLSDFWSRRLVYGAGCVFLMAFALPYYQLLGTGEPAWILLATVLALAGGHALLYSVQASLIPELFGTRLRYTGASLGYQLAVPIAGGLSPILAASLVEVFPDQPWLLGQYIIVLSAVSLGCVALLTETSQKDLSAAE
jgi:metabolite-proton symporter